MIKYRVAAAIGSLGRVSYWIKRLELGLIYLSATTMFWLCQRGIPELLQTLPRLSEVTVVFTSDTDFANLHGHDLVEYANGRISQLQMPVYYNLPPKENFAAFFDGIVKTLRGSHVLQVVSAMCRLLENKIDMTWQPNRPKYPEILQINTNVPRSSIEDDAYLFFDEDSTIVITEIMLSHSKCIFEAMAGDIPKGYSKSPMNAEDVRLQMQVKKLLNKVIEPRWGIREGSWMV